MELLDHEYERIRLLNEAAQDSIKALLCAWNEVQSKSYPAERLSVFNGHVRRILETSRITRDWPSTDLPPQKKSEGELRGAWLVNSKWRQQYFRRAIATLLTILEQSDPPFGKKFWQEDFPAHWIHLALSANSKANPSILPSQTRPKPSPRATDSVPTAFNPSYTEWANDILPCRIARQLPALADYLSVADYDPRNPKALRQHGLVLSAVATHLVAHKLDLHLEDMTGELAITALLDPDYDPFRSISRYNRGGGYDEHIWPGERRIYVDLTMRPILLQVINHRENGWDNPVLSISLTEADSLVKGGVLHRNGLQRLHIELATWCDVGMTLAEATHPAHMARGQEPKMNDIPGLPPYRHAAAQQLKSLAHSVSKTAGTRFVIDDALDANTIRNMLSEPYLHIDNMTILPTSLVTPVLEENTLYLNLDWEWLAPKAEWMKLYLLALNGAEGRIVTIDYGENPEIGADRGSPLGLKLQGPVWEKLRESCHPEALMAACTDALFCRLEDGSDLGVAVMALLDLSSAVR